MSVVFMIFKIIGIILLTIIGLLAAALLLVLFVPIRYQVTAYKMAEKQPPIFAQVKITWLLHIITVIFSYPDAAHIKAKLFFFTVFNSSQKKKESKTAKKKSKKIKVKKIKAKEDTEKDKTDEIKQIVDPNQEKSVENRALPAEETAEDQALPAKKTVADQNESAEKTGFIKKIKKFFNKLKVFFVKIKQAILNIGYTIRKIYDKIKEVMSNFSYYAEIIKSEEFQEVFHLCTVQLNKLYQNVKPSKLRAALTIGTGDPASTGQILIIFSMLYPIIGNNIFIVPDFDDFIVEGEFYMKGRISAYVILWAAFIIYKDKNLRKVISMFNGGSLNGRK